MFNNNNRSFTSPSMSTTSMSLFGSPNASSTFGNSQNYGTSTTNASIFGSSNSNTSFGASGNTGVFGANNNTSFGNTTGGGIFGSNTTAQNNSLFGGSNTGGVFGSTVSKGTNQYNDTTSNALGKNPNSNNSRKVDCTFIKHHIYFMNQYNKKPISLLRSEDYEINKTNPTMGGLGTNTLGSGGLFGNPTSNANTFGNNNNNSNPLGVGGGIGGGSLFGNNPTTNNTTPFGNTNNNGGGLGGGLFGGNNNNNNNNTAFGGGIFGSNPTSGIFGSGNNNSNNGLFGSNNNNNNNNTFGGGCLFGNNNNNNTGIGGGLGGGLFGNNNNNNNNNTGGLGTGLGGGGLFGNNKPAVGGIGGGLFGNNNNNTGIGGGGLGGGLFGNNNNNNTGIGGGGLGGGLFGNNTTSNTGTGLFGTSNTTNPTGSSGLFGTSTTNASSGGLFGNNNTTATGGGLFGTPNTSNTGAIGGGGLFGTPNANTSGGIGGGLFGNNNNNNKPAGSGLFGSTNTGGIGSGSGGLFGGNTTTNTTGGGLFGTSTPSNTGGLFGSNNTATTGGGGLFGNNNNKPTGGGLFGSNTTTGLGGSGGGLFGNNTTTGLGGGGGLFGNTNTNTGGGLFGNNNNNNNGLGGGLFGNTNANNNNNQNQFNSQFTEQIVDACKKEPYTQGEFGLLKIGQQIDHCAQAAGVSNTASVENTSLSTKPNTIALPPLPSHTSILSKSLFSQKKTDCVIAPPSIISRCSKIKQLIITQPVNDDDDEQKDSQSDEVIPVINSPYISPIKPDESDYYKTLSDTELSKEENDDDDDNNSSSSDNENDESNYSQNESGSESDSVKRSNPMSPIAKTKHHKTDSNTDYNDDNDNNEENESSTSSANSSESEGDDEKDEEDDDNQAPTCSKEDYIVFPSINSLKTKSNTQLSSVRDFSICHKNIASVLWLGTTDVRNINIDENVIIELDDNNRPYVEVKSEKVPSLNKTAIITLYQIKRPENVDLQEFKNKLIKRAKKMDATHLDYDDRNSQWRFQVEHFSRYGFMEEEDEDDSDNNNNNEEDMNKNKITTTTTTVNPFFSSNNNDDYTIPIMIPNPKQKSTTIKFNQNIFQSKSSSLVMEEEEENSSNNNNNQVNQSSNISFSNRPQLPKIEFNRLPMKQSPCFSLLQEVVGKEINSDSVHAFSVYCKDRSRPAFISFNNKIISIETKNFSFVNCYAIPQTQSLVNYDEMKLMLHSLLNITEISEDSNDNNNDDSSSSSSSSSNLEEEENSNDEYNKPFRLGPISSVYDFLSDYSSPLSSSSQSYPPVVSAMFSLLLSLYLPRDSRNEIPNFIHEIQPDSTISDRNNSDDSDTNSDNEKDDDDNNEKWQSLLYRREKITEWLISIISNLSLPLPINVYQKILYHLLENDIEAATNEAFNNNDFNLSLLISQLNGDITTGNINNGYNNNNDRITAMQLQLECWKKYKIINKMNKDLLNIYYILAGEIQLIQLPSNISKLPWICYVALYYWYGNKSCGSLLSSLKYFKKYNEYLIHPSPLFYYNLITNNNNNNNNNKRRTDILYHLLWYYAEESYDICHLLNNCSISGNSHDYFFTWVLYYIIISINNYNVSESDMKNQVYINNSFIEQLEDNGLWEWAIYVGRFNVNRETRSVVCKEILDRNIPERINQKYKSIKQFLNENKIISDEEIKDAEKLRKF